MLSLTLLVCVGCFIRGKLLLGALILPANPQNTDIYEQRQICKYFHSFTMKPGNVCCIDHNTVQVNCLRSISANIKYLVVQVWSPWTSLLLNVIKLKFKKKLGIIISGEEYPLLPFFQEQCNWSVRKTKRFNLSTLYLTAPHLCIIFFQHIDIKIR